MKLQNSYIFLKHPYKETQSSSQDKDGTIVIELGKNVHSYIKQAFPFVSKVEDSGNFYKRKYIGTIQNDKNVCNVEFVITDVADVKYLDVFVEGKSKSQIIGCLEFIQDTLLNSGIRETYVEIISYDSISEYYCNKMSVKLNTLERNLRKLLFNIYVLNFGKDYYQATMDIELQKKIKGLINSSNSSEQKNAIKKAYKVSSNTQAAVISCLQQFFYSFELGDIQNFLFKPTWTEIDEKDKQKFLAEHEDLSELSDAELRTAIIQLSPKSDWERFFSEKVAIDDIEGMIDKIRKYRNSVAHYKFFNQNDYKNCNKLVARFNKAILSAIKITEEVDFVEKNNMTLREALSNFAERLNQIVNPVKEAAQKFFQSSAFQQLTGISRILQESAGALAMNSALSSVEKSVTHFFDDDELEEDDDEGDS